MRRRNETIPMNSRNLATPQKPYADSATNPDAQPRRRSVNARVSAVSGSETPIEIPAPVTVAETGGRTAPTVKTIEHIEYSGHILKVEPQRGGWKTSIYPHGSPFALHRIAYTTEPSGRDLVIAEAKSIVDATTLRAPPSEAAVAQAETIQPESMEIEKIFDQFAGSLLRWSDSALSALKRIYFSIDDRR